MRHASLFTGFGGFDLASKWIGWENTFQVEKDPFCQQVLAHHFPKTDRYHDIKVFDGTKYRGAIDVLSGGFPCQPYSTAGKRLGKDDERHLWPEKLRVIREVQPPWVVGENVRGLVSWSGGLVFEEVCADLEAEGYEVQPFLLPAAGVNAPHLRERIIFVAYSGSVRQYAKRPEQPLFGHSANGDEKSTSDTKGIRERKPTDETHPITEGRETWIELGGAGWAIAYPYSDQRPKGRMHAAQSKTTERYTSPCAAWASGNWQDFPTQSPICGGNDGLPRRLDRASVFAGVPDKKRKSTFSRWREESLKGYGNAVVPQMILPIFNAIQEYEDLCV